MPTAQNAEISVSSCSWKRSVIQPMTSADPTAAISAPCIGSWPKKSAAPMPPSTLCEMPPARKPMRLTTT